LPSPKKFLQGKSLGALFRKLRQKVLGGGHPEPEIFYIPFNYSIPVHKLDILIDDGRILKAKRSKKERLKTLKEVAEKLDTLEMLEEIDD